jgi:hypothetical protein
MIKSIAACMGGERTLIQDRLDALMLMRRLAPYCWSVAATLDR